MTIATPDNPPSDPTKRTKDAGRQTADDGSVWASGRSAPDGLGQVLRDAYRDALDEGVPDDMLDLLRKLD